LRSALREYYPAALDAFDDLAHRDALTILERASTPAQAARPSAASIATMLGRAGRKRNLDARAAQIARALSSEQLAAPAVVADAFAATTIAQVRIITALNAQIDQLASRLAEGFEQHPDAVIYRFPARTW
jgi:hypothetical protein